MFVVSDDRMRPENNNLTLVRLLLASAVIWTHSVWRVTGRSGWDEATPWLGAPISNFAVNGFFFLSGYLVYASLLRRSSVRSFLFARFARLWPALAVAVCLIVAGGALITITPGIAYLKGDTARFLLGNLSLTQGAYTLTGVSCGAAPCNVNGSLWTITWEARCYLLLALALPLGLASPRAMKRLVLPAVLAFAIVVHLPPVVALLSHHEGLAYNIAIADRLMTMFALGIAALIWRERLVLSWWVLAALLALLVISSRYAPVPHLDGIVIAYTVLCAGFLSARRGSLSGTWPDYSYGIYIYAFPTMMLLAGSIAFRSHVTLALANFAATVPLAALSWHLVEAPLLRVVRRWRGRKVSLPSSVRVGPNMPLAASDHS